MQKPDSKTYSLERQLARSYHKLLTCLDWNDQLMIRGLREGLNKYISNAYLAAFPGIRRKHHLTHFISEAALTKLKADQYGELVFEHLVPKSANIQKPCEILAAEGLLTVEYVEDLLVRYWKLATISREEDRKLHSRKMPEDWDLCNVFARYEAAGIELVPNPYHPDPDRPWP